jgi:CheY-like chemotaxis protein
VDNPPGNTKWRTRSAVKLNCKSVRRSGSISHPEVVLLDIEMPRLDGRAVAREIRCVRAKPAPLLLAVTGLIEPSEWAESTRAGFDHHFVKPVLMPVVLAAINLWLARR